MKKLRNIRRTMWFDDGRWTKMKAAAKSDERSVSSWLRILVDAALRRLDKNNAAV